MSQVKIPESGTKIKMINSELKVPDDPIIPFIEGDGIGSDIWKASKEVIDAAVQKSYNGNLYFAKRKKNCLCYKKR